MLKRPLGKTALNVSQLGLGTVKFGRNVGVKYPRPFKLPTDGQIADLLALAQSLGMNLLDTAPSYGNSEERIGEAIEGSRESWLLCTKAGEDFIGGRSRYDFGEERVLRSVANSLRSLRTDYLDVLLLHADGRSVAEIESAGAFRALRRLQREGVVKAIGFSAKGLADGRAAMAHCDALMCTVNAGYREELPLLDACATAGIGVLVKKPLASGYERTPQRRIASIAALPGATSIVVGTLNAEHLAANAAALDATPT